MIVTFFMKKKYFKILAWLSLTPLLLILLCNLIIISFAKDKTFEDLNRIPKNKVGIILGTSKKLIGGSPNLYYSYRIKATVALFRAKKIEYVLVKW